MTTTALKEFHLFPKLPAELRCIIWRHTLPDLTDPQNLTVESEYRRAAGTSTQHFFSPDGITQDDERLVALRVCSESRHESKLVLKNHEFTLQLHKPFLFNLEVDTLTIKHPYQARMFSGFSYSILASRKNVCYWKGRHVSIRGLGGRNDIIGRAALCKTLCFFTGCRNFKLYVDPHNKAKWENEICEKIRRTFRFAWEREMGKGKDRGDVDTLPELTFIWEV